MDQQVASPWKPEAGVDHQGFVSTEVLPKPFCGIVWY